MRHILIFLFSALIHQYSFAQNEATNFYLIRHAEKDSSEKGIKDPHLTEEGKRRALNWANVLQNISFDAIYSTDYIRTRETAMPIAKNKNLNILLYDPNSLDAKEFIESHKGMSVLIVGHSNTTPNLVNKIIGQDKYGQINDDNNSNLYIVTIIDSHITDFLLVIDY